MVSLHSCHCNKRFQAAKMPIDSLEEFSYNLIWNCTPRREPCIALSQLRCTDTNTILICVPRLKPSKFRSIQSNWLDFNPHTKTESISTLTLKSGQFLSPAQTPSPFDSNTEIMSIYISNLKSSQYRCATKTKSIPILLWNDVNLDASTQNPGQVRFLP